MNNNDTKFSYGTVPDKEYQYSAYPDDNYRPFKKKKRKKGEELWVAPEHRRHASYMEKAYDVDHKGRKMVENGKRLVLDPRPTIMIPEKPKIFLGLDQM